MKNKMNNQNEKEYLNKNEQNKKKNVLQNECRK
jgi:hypothetical protein